MQKITALLAAPLALMACSGEPDFEFQGELSALFLSTGDILLRLSIDGTVYTLEFDDETDYTNIEQTPAGEVWLTGGIYGVNGELIENERLSVDVIGYIPPAGETNLGPEEKERLKKCASLDRRIGNFAFDRNKAELEAKDVERLWGEVPLLEEARATVTKFEGLIEDAEQEKARLGCK